MGLLLVIDGEPDAIAGQVRQAFPGLTYRVETARTAAEGLFRITEDRPDVVLLDLSLPDRCGLEVLQSIRAMDAGIPVIFVAHLKTADAAIEAMKRGALDYLSKPLEPGQLRQVLSEALEIAARTRKPAVARDALTDDDFSGAIVGACPAMREVYKSVGRVAAQDVPVLITGESGTGKELVAKAIHQHSHRCSQPFFALNCAAIPEALLESELFGHEKGAFTGADRRRIGRFEQVNGGTLFLDEIGDMPLALQAKILRVLQEQSFERIGGNETIRTDVRIVSATHRDVKGMAAAGRFRADLYYRLGVFSVHLPPLRERGDDLAPLIRYFLRRLGREMGRDVYDVSPEALDRLRDYHWPGNLRELQSVLRQALLKANGPVLLPSMVPELTLAQQPSTANPGQTRLEEFVRALLADGSEELHKVAHREFDRMLVPLVMQRTRGNQREAARVLGIARQTLRQRLRELRISPRFA